MATATHPSDTPVPAAPGAEVDRSEIEELVRGGRYLEAARRLSAVPEDRRASADDVEVVRLRHLAFGELRRTPAPTWPGGEAIAQDPFPGAVDPPEIHATELTARLIAGAIQHHGCIIVRGLLDAEDCAGLRDDMDRAFAAFDQHLAGASVGQTAPWFAPLDQTYGDEIDPIATAFLRQGGGVYGPQSPRTFIRYFDLLERAGHLAVVEDLLGEPPLVSLNKNVLRRIGGGARPSWHQDGFYLGLDTRAVNLWTALSPCGGDRPLMGLDLVPRRLDGLARSGTHDALHPRTVSQAVAEELAAERGKQIVRPEFDPGDGIFFDQIFLHQSDIRPLPEERYAIESWFFAPSTCPDHQIPIAVR